jgi:hypothetical protein
VRVYLEAYGEIQTAKAVIPETKMPEAANIRPA